MCGPRGGRTSVSWVSWTARAHDNGHDDTVVLSYEVSLAGGVRSGRVVAFGREDKFLLCLTQKCCFCKCQAMSVVTDLRSIRLVTVVEVLTDTAKAKVVTLPA